MVTPATSPRRTRVAPPPRADRYQRHVGSALTPQQAKRVLGEADLGRLAELADLLDELRETDAHLHAVLHKREHLVAGAAWEVRAADESAAARRAAAYVDGVLRELDAALQDALAHLQGAVYHGRAALEVVWSRGRGGYLVPTALEPIHARRLAIGEDWRLGLYDPGELGSRFATWPGVPFDTFPAGKFVVHQPRIRGVYPQREGLGRPLLFMSMFKRWTIRDALALAEMAGRKGRVGKYATGKDPKNPAVASDEDIDKLEEALTNWSTATALVVPDTAQVEFEDPVSGTTIHTPLIELFNAEMSKCVLGGTLTTDAGDRGARSLGETQREEQLAIAKSDARAVEGTLRAALLGPIARERYGDRVPVPRLALVVEPKQDADLVADRLTKFVGIGGKVTQEAARNLLGLPDPQPDEELLGAAPVVATTPPGAAPSTPARQDAEESTDGSA